MKKKRFNSVLSLIVGFMLIGALCKLKGKSLQVRSEKVEGRNFVICRR